MKKKRSVTPRFFYKQYPIFQYRLLTWSSDTWMDAPYRVQNYHELKSFLIAKYPSGSERVYIRRLDNSGVAEIQSSEYI